MIIKKIRPMFRGVVTTAHKYAIDDCPKGALIDPRKMQGTLKEEQIVVAVGPSVSSVKVGELVHIEMMHFAKLKAYKPGDGMRAVINGKEMTVEGFEVPVIELESGEHLYIQETDIDYVIEEKADETSQSPLIIPSTQIIVP